LSESQPEVEVEVVAFSLELFESRQPSAWSAFLERLRVARLRSGVAVAVGAAVELGAAVASVVGAAVAVLSAVGDAITVSTGEGKGVGVLSVAGSAVAVEDGCGAGDSAAGGVAVVVAAGS
jgi:hypothetical protein